MIKTNFVWYKNPVDVTSKANFIWSIANILRGVYMPDKSSDVIIPMTILRRFECTLENTKDKVVAMYEANRNLPEQALCRASGYQFFNTSHFNLKELYNDADSSLDREKVAVKVKRVIRREHWLSPYRVSDSALVKKEVFYPE